MQTNSAGTRTQPLRAVLVDGDQRVRDSLAGLVGLGDGVVVVGVAGFADEAVELACANDAQVVVLDPKLPEIDAGLAAISMLRARLPKVRIVVMSWLPELEAPSIASGADAFVLKSAAPNELIDAMLPSDPGR